MTLDETERLITHLRAMGVRSYKDPATGLEVVFEPAQPTGSAVRTTMTVPYRDPGWGPPPSET